MKNRNKGTSWAIWAVLGVLAILFVIIKRESFSSFISQIFRILRPVIIGAVIAYLSNPIFRMFEKYAFSGIRSFSVRRAISLLGTYLVLVLIVVVLMLLIIPQLLSSAQDFLDNYEVLLETSMDNINDLLNQINANFNLKIPPVKHENLKQGIDWLVSNINVEELLDRFLSGNTILVILEYIGDTFSILTDIIFGLFISLYLLSGKERIYAQITRTRKALFNRRFNERITRIVTIADQSFGGFLRGKLLDSTIVGILTYIIISIMGVPYTLLIAVIIGITDIVPVVGPWIGVLPSALIILLTDPIKVIPFLLAILIVQQVDGNIIAPKILGENTGVSSLCVMIAITVMGAIWGLAGMVLGVPLFATIIELTNEFLNKRLQDKGLPTDAGVDETKQEKMPLKKTAISLSDGCGPVTQQEKKHLLAFALVNKYDLYTPQNNATLAACTGEYLDAAADFEAQVTEVPEVAENTDLDSATEESILEQAATSEE